MNVIRDIDRKWIVVKMREFVINLVGDKIGIINGDEEKNDGVQILNRVVEQNGGPQDFQCQVVIHEHVSTVYLATGNSSN